MFIWGGGSNQVERYDFILDSWQVLSTLISPPDRYGAAFSVFENMLYIFGGIDLNGNYLNDLWTFDLDSTTWINTGASSPLPRFGASLNLVPLSPSLILFGGLNSVGSMSDVWYFNTVDNSWNDMTPVESDIPGRYGHGSYIQNDQLVVVLGESSDPRNIWIWDFEFETWAVQQKASYQASPSPRVGFAGVQDLGNYYYIFGGEGEGDQLMPDIWQLRTDNYSWWLVGCNSGYDYVFPMCQLIEMPPIDTCSECMECNADGPIRQAYVSGIAQDILSVPLVDC